MVRLTQSNTYMFYIHLNGSEKIVFTVLVRIKLTKNPVSLVLRCSSGKLYFVVISLCFAIYKNVVHILEPGETPSNSASHQASNYVQHS